MELENFAKTGVYPYLP